MRDRLEHGMQHERAPAELTRWQRKAAELRAEAFRLIKRADDLETRVFRSQQEKPEEAAYKAAKAA
jgi:hypothetical protein